MAGIDYNDERFQQVEKDKNAAISESDKLYEGMIDKSDQYYQDQIDASKEWADKQQQLQQDQTDFAIEQINQNKDQTHKDYLKEQSGAYKDWRKASNEYGANAEQMAANGLAGTGYSESSQVSMYNTYQNRVMMARESYQKAILNYDNAIKDAQLQNNSVLAQIAYESLQKQLELSLQGFQYKNQLILDQANRKQELDNTYYGRYQDVLAQINQENSLAEEIRQYNENMQLQREKFEYDKAQDEKNYQLQLKKIQQAGISKEATIAKEANISKNSKKSLPDSVIKASMIGLKTKSQQADYIDGLYNKGYIDADTWNRMYNTYKLDTGNYAGAGGRNSQTKMMVR